MTTPTPTAAVLHPAAVEPDLCHCGEAVHVHDDGFSRGLCYECDLNRCDTSEGMEDGCPAVGLCKCGKPATHLDAPEDSADWACRVTSAAEYSKAHAGLEVTWRPADAAVYGPHTVAEIDRLRGTS